MTPHIVFLFYVTFLIQLACFEELVYCMRKDFFPG